jgi:hypothetical protein
LLSLLRRPTASAIGLRRRSGFLIEAYKPILAPHPALTQIEQLKTKTYRGREYANEAIPICLDDMVLHDIDLLRV